MEIYAIVENGLVTNVVVWDGDESAGWQPPSGASSIQIPDGAEVGIGWAYDGTKFTRPAV